jgi:cell division protein FtsW
MKYLLLVVVSAVFAMGLVMIYSTTSAEVIDHDLEFGSHQGFIKQIIFAVVGVGMGISIAKIGYKRFVDMSPSLLALFTFLLVLTLVPGVGRVVNGSRRWIGVGGFSFQPSEFVKYIIPAFFVYRYLQLKEFDLKKLLQVVSIVAVPMGLILIEPNNGTVVVIGMTLFVLCLLTRVPMKFWAWPLVGFMLVGGAFAYNLPYVSARIKVYLNPELDLRGKGHQPYQAKIATGSGKVLGLGPGESWQKLSFLPEAQNDYIAAVFAEEYGFLGMVILITCYMAIAYFGFHIAANAKDEAGFYMGSIITFLITMQAFLNLGVVSGLLPSTGLNLPFFSQGGSSLMANIMGIGLLLSIHQSKALKLA